MCNRDRFCFLIKDDAGEPYKVLCQFTDATNPPEGWNHVGTAKDRRPIFAKEGSKSKRRKSKKYPDVLDLQPQKKADIPSYQDVRLSVQDVDKGHTVRLKPGNPGGTETLHIIHRIDGKRVQGKQTLVAKLKVKDSLGAGTMEVPLSQIAEVLTHDSETGAKEQFIEYYYSETQKVVRTQWSDRRKVYQGNQSKQIRPYWQDENGDWHCGKGDQPWVLYRQNEAIRTIQSGGIVFAVGGEPCVESFRSIGLTGTCNQGGEGELQQIAEPLSEAFQCANTLAEEEIDQDLAKEGIELPGDNLGLKPLLIIWPDNDITGRGSAEALLKACYRQKVTAVAIDPLLLWSEMPEKGDAKDWIDHCKSSGISNEQMYRMLENAIEEAINQQEEEAQYRWQRDAWQAPMSYRGEIGEWIKVGRGDKAKRIWQPLCNFDFVVEREVKDEFGGALVLQIKRSFDNHQERIILNSTDYTKVDAFTDAVKRALGVGVVCNLNKSQLGALINVRLHEYRTTRQGKLFRRIDRYGQQADGTWVFRDRQYTKDGYPTNENETRWIFNPSLGKDDFIPCPELADEDPKALKHLVDASRQFFGKKNINQVLLTFGWVAAGLHSQEIFKRDSSFPLDNLHGDPGSCKTLAAETALSLIGTNWPQVGILSRVSVSALYEHGSRTGSLPFFWDDPDRSPENEEVAKNWYNRKPRKVRWNEQVPTSPMGITSNHVFGGDHPATHTRFARTAFERASEGSKESFQELKAAQAKASGAFPQLLKLGYSAEEVAALERELLVYLPMAHARIAQNLAIMTWYAQKLVAMTGGLENIKQWVIDHLCQAENNADSAGDSLQDFIEKLLALESESKVGDWNLKRNIERSGRSYTAIYAANVWSLVDNRFKPATYNAKALKPLIIRVGGILDSTVRFAKSQDQVLAYERALISPRMSEGAELSPNPPETIPRKAWLIPSELFGGNDWDKEPNLVTDVTDCNQNSVTSSNDEIASISGTQNSNCNCVTEKKEFKEKESLTESYEVPSLQVEANSPNLGYTSYTVTLTTETITEMGLEPVTETSENPVTVQDISVTEAIAPTPASTEVGLPIYQRSDGGFGIEHSSQDVAPTTELENAAPILPTDVEVENIEWESYLEKKPYPTPNPERAHLIRSAYQNANSKADLAVLKETYSEAELKWAWNWLKNCFPAEFERLEVAAATE